MPARHQVSRAALELIMGFEGYRPKAARLADGRWTIGYGHTLTAREGAQVSPQDAEDLLIYDLIPVAAAVNELTYTPLNQNQFDALTAFAHNVGVDNFRRSAVLRRVNEGALIQAAYALEMWRKADFEGERIVVDALVRRRSAEKTLFLTPIDGWVPAPSQILSPKVDYDVNWALPEDATVLETPLTGDVAEARRADAPETSPASMAAADAVTARLDEILRQTDDGQPTEAEIAPSVETVAAPDPAAPASLAEMIVPDAGQPVVAEPETAPADAPRAEAPQSNPIDLSRRVVWREAPAETDVQRLIEGGGKKSIPQVVLAAWFLAGVAMFAGGIGWGMSARGSSSFSWILGLVGIVCVVSAVYIYLERLGRRET